MKKRYGLENIIGKKSKIRFPSHVFVPKNRDPLYFTLPAYAAEAEPPLSTAITMKKGDPIEFVDQFNEESYEYEEGLPLNVVIYVSNSSLLFEIKPPSISSLFGIVFDLEDTTNSRFKAYRNNIFSAVFNFGLMHQDPNEDFFISELVSKVKSIYGALNTFTIRRRRKKKSRWFLPKLRARRAILNVSNRLIAKRLRHRKFKRFRQKTTNHLFRKHSMKETLLYYKEYDLYENLADFEDLFWDDLISSIIEDQLEYTQQSLAYLITDANLTGLKISLFSIEAIKELVSDIIKLITSNGYLLSIYYKHYLYQTIPSLINILEILDELVPYDEENNEIDFESVENLAISSESNDNPMYDDNDDYDYFLNYDDDI